jgi:putative Holliday junction resolvase
MLNSTVHSPNNWIMAFDFGESRIGSAVGNTLLKIPHPLLTISGHNKFEKFAKIGKLIDEWRPILLIVGMPSNKENKELFIQSIIRFSNRLKNNFKLPLNFVNEDYTSQEAGNLLKEQNIYGNAQKGKLDSLAACGILQTYFSSI